MASHKTIYYDIHFYKIIFSEELENIRHKLGERRLMHLTGYTGLIITWLHQLTTPFNAHARDSSEKWSQPCLRLDSSVKQFILHVLSEHSKSTQIQ
jgi:hypothetical protein